MDSFRKEYWMEKMKFPDWYLKLANELNEVVFHPKDSKKTKPLRRKIYKLVDEMLQKKEIPLGKKGPNLDYERKSIDTVVIHHTSENSNISLTRLSAIGFIRQYGKNYLEDKFINGHNLKGQPIWSNHFRDGEMVFYAYHWLIRPDGRIERLLEDKFIGWQAGNWDINTRSVAIALSGEYEHESPPLPQIKSAARIIREHYQKIEKTRIFGHREVNPKTTCPGDEFLNSWKNILLQDF